MPDDRKTKLHCMEAAAIVTAAVWFLLSVLWDFYFDMNDDVLMKDILSGIYTGVPEALNIQMLAPVSFLSVSCTICPGGQTGMVSFCCCCRRSPSSWCWKRHCTCPENAGGHRIRKGTDPSGSPSRVRMTESSGSAGWSWPVQRSPVRRCC